MTEREQPYRHDSMVRRLFDHMPVMTSPRVLITSVDVGESPMTEQQWLTSDDPAAMLRCLCGQDGPYTHAGHPFCTPSDRQLRLFACACLLARHGDGWEHLEEYYQKAEIGGSPYMPGCTAVEQAMALAYTHVQGDFQADFLRCIFGNPWRPVEVEEVVPFTTEERKRADDDCDGDGPFPNVCRARWLNPTVLSIARAIHESRDFSGMLALHDALLEAGLPETVECGDCRGAGGAGSSTLFGCCSLCNGFGRLLHPILEHCRNGQVHARGCHVLDLFLGKE